MFKRLRRAIVWLIGHLGLAAPTGVLAAVATYFVIGIIGSIIAAFLIFLVVKIGPLIFDEFVKSDEFILAISVIIVIVPAVATYLPAGLKDAVTIAVGSILPVIASRSILRELQKERREKKGPLETPPT